MNTFEINILFLIIITFIYVIIILTRIDEYLEIFGPHNFRHIVISSIVIKMSILLIENYQTSD